MAAYKVLQDIEAEDKLVGPMTAKQLLYAGVASAFLFVGYLVGDRTTWWVMLAFLIPALPFIYLAAPLGQDQPNDIWLLSRLNYLFRARKRTWQQAAHVKRRVVIKAKPAAVITSRRQADGAVDSHLRALAGTLDTRAGRFELPAGPGWVGGQPLVDPYLSEEHPAASRFDSLLNAYQARAQSATQARLQPDQAQAPATGPLAQVPSATINQLATTDDLKVSTIANLANQPTAQPRT